MNNAAIQGLRLTHEEMRSQVCKRTMTAKEMALASHNLSKTGDMATLADDSVYIWDGRFEHWACWKAPRKGAA